MSNHYSYGLREAKWYERTADGDLCEGGATSPTHADGIDIGCVVEVSWVEELAEAEVPGNDAICCEISRIRKLTVTLRASGLNPELVAALTGRTHSTFTAGGNDGERVKATTQDSAPYGALIAASDDGCGLGDLHVIFWNVRFKPGPDGGLVFETALETSMTATGYKSRLGTCVDWWDILTHDDAKVAPPTVFPGTAAY